MKNCRIISLSFTIPVLEKARATIFEAEKMAPICKIGS